MSTSGDPRDGGQYPPPGGYEQNPAGLGPGYGQGPGYGEPLRRPRNGFGIAALVLGLLALVLCWTIIGGIVLGLLALVFGLLGRARVKRGQATNGGLAVAGIVLGIIGLLISIGIVAFGVSILNSPAGQSYQQCIEESGGDPAAIEQCASELAPRVGDG